LLLEIEITGFNLPLICHFWTFVIKDVQGSELHAFNYPLIGCWRSVIYRPSCGIWYHEHWSPVNTDTYPGCVRTDTGLRKRLCKDNANMRCNHCSKVRRFQPTTHVKGHLVSGGLNFQATEAWMSKDVQDEVSKNVTQVCLSVAAFA
jgi:hypothetical protein